MEAIEIKNRSNEAVLYSGEHADVKEAVEAAVKAGANLRGAHLDGAVSEKVIVSGHSVQETPQAILELRRILRIDMARHEPRGQR